MKLPIYLLLFLNISLTKHVLAFNPLSALLSFGGFLKDNTYCMFGECCTKKYIPADFNKLEALLKERVYGQHIAQRLILDALRSHWDNPYLQKALTLSFHGTPGAGKNYISSFITESIYKNGAESDYVHHFMGRIHFPEDSKTLQYQENLYSWIKGNVTKCPYQVFIFDEVDKMPPKLLDIIKPVIDYNENVEKVDYRKCIFIFLSNTGSSLVMQQMDKLWHAGKQRQQLKLADFENLVSQGAFNEIGGFHHSDTIKSNLIDHYIPFLPLEIDHVRLCILDTFKRIGLSNPPEEAVMEVLEHVEWGPLPSKRFSKTGCKRLSQKVAVVGQQYKTYRDDL